MPKSARSPASYPLSLTTEEKRKVWLRAPWDARVLQWKLPDGVLRIVLQGEKQDGDAELVNLADQASRPHAPMPLPLLVGIMDQPDDAATVAMVENKGRSRSYLATFAAGATSSTAQFGPSPPRSGRRISPATR